MPSVGGSKSSLPTTGGATAAIGISVCVREGGGLRAFESGVCEKRDFSVSSCFCAWVGAEATSDSNSKGCLKKLNHRFLDLNLNLVPEPLKFEFLPEDFRVVT